MNNSEKVSSASPSPTQHDRYSTNNKRRQTSRHTTSTMARSRSVSVSSPGPSRTPSRSSRSISKHRSPRHYVDRQKTSYQRPRSRSREQIRRRQSSPPHQPSSFRDSYHRSSSYQSQDVDRLEEYTSICIKNLNESIDLDHLYASIYAEFKRYGQFTIKIVLNKKTLSLSHSRTERIAFVNFYNHETASAAKRGANNKMLCGLAMYIEPVYKNYKPGTIPPPPPSSHYYSERRSRSPPRSYPPPPPPPPRRRSRSRSVSPREFFKYKTREYPEYERRSPSRPYPPRHEPRYEAPRHEPPRQEHRYEPKTEPAYFKRDERKDHNYKRRSPSTPHLIPTRARTPPPPSVKHKYDDLAYKLSRSRSRSPKSRSGRPLPLMNISVTPGGVTHYFDNDDKDQTRTLFIGNLDADIEKDYLWKQFEKYGVVEEIDVKKNLPTQPPYAQNNSADYSSTKKTYAFVRFENMDMAKEAKMHMNGKRIGQNEIKIGYGKVQATNCLWIGGLNEKTRIKDLEKEIKYILNTNDTSKFDILYNAPNIFAYVLFYNVKHAEQVRFELRGKTIPNSEKLRVDYHDPKMFNLVKPNRSRSRSESPNKRRVVEIEPQANDESEPEVKPKKTRMSSVVSSNGSSETKQNYENIIITKIDNVRRVDAISTKARSRSRSSTPQSNKKNRRSLTPPPVKEDVPKIEINDEIKQSKKDADRDRDEGELWDDDYQPPSRQVIKHSVISDSYICLSRSLLAKSLRSLGELKETLEPYTSWSGLFTLKKNSFPIKFYLLAGNKNLSEHLLPSNNRDMNLHINQRIRLDSSKLDDIEKRLIEKVQDDSPIYSVYMCLACDLVKGDRTIHSKRSLNNLVTYLNQKSASGVVSLPDDSRPQANLNIFTATSNLSVKLMKQLLPNFKLDETNEEESNYLLCILLKSPNASLA